MNNLDIMTPTIGSNQFVSKFGTKAKRKFKLKFKTKLQLMAGIVLIASLAANYLLLKQFMVMKCADGGYFISKQYCGELAQNKFDSQELAREEFIKNNFNNYDN